MKTKRDQPNPAARPSSAAEEASSPHPLAKLQQAVLADLAHAEAAQAAAKAPIPPRNLRHEKAEPRYCGNPRMSAAVPPLPTPEPPPQDQRPPARQAHAGDRPFAAIFVPDFALQALLRSTPERWSTPIALLTDKASLDAGAGFRPPASGPSAIWQCTPAARAAGAVPGMTPSQAQARCGPLEVRLRSEAAERSARAALLDCAGAFSPYVEDTAAGICTFELKTARELQPAQLAHSLLGRLRRLHLHARLGFAPNPDLALLAAQSSGTGVPPVDRAPDPAWRQIYTAAELHTLPLDALPFPAPMREILHRWGIATLGAFVALGREPLADRLGPEVLPLFDRAIGALRRPLRCLPPAPSYEEALDLEHEIETLEPLLFLLRRLLEQILVRLEDTYLVAAHLTLRLGFSHRPPYERTFKIPAPTARVEVLFRALHTHLERFTAEEPIVSLALAATPCRPPRQQFGLFESALRDPNQFFETLARLAALLGNDRVGFPILEDTHRPDAFRLQEAPVELEADGQGSEARGQKPEAGSQRPEGGDSKPAPALTLRRFRPPIPVKVELNPQRQPIALHSAALRGRALAAEGPIQISGEWWAEKAWSRVEWDIELEDGPLCRVYQDRVGETWFLEGVYD